jgi:hypothetical protein
MTPPSPPLGPPDPGAADVNPGTVTTVTAADDGLVGAGTSGAPPHPANSSPNPHSAAAIRGAENPAAVNRIAAPWAVP